MTEPVQSQLEGQGALKAPWPYWGFWPKFLITMLLFYTVPYGDYLINAVVYHSLIHITDTHKAYFYNDIIETFGNTIAYLAIAHWGLKLFNLSIESIGFKKINWTKAIVQISLGLVLMLIQAYGIDFPLFHSNDLFFFRHLPIGFSLAWSPSSFADPTFWCDNIFGFILLGGIVEEILNRGILYTALRARFSPSGTILVTAAYFSLSHLIWHAPNPGFLFLFSTFIFGVLLGCLREWSGTLWGPIAGHLAYDFLYYWVLIYWRWY